jgi:hypothetical protein
MSPNERIPRIDRDRLYLADGGLETTMIYREGIDLPHFASFLLLEDHGGREALRRYYRNHIEIARRHRLGSRSTRAIRSTSVPDTALSSTARPTWSWSAAAAEPIRATSPASARTGLRESHGQLKVPGTPVGTGSTTASARLESQRRAMSDTASRKRSMSLALL